MSVHFPCPDQIKYIVKHILIVIILVGSTGLCAAEDGPNIAFILADDLGYGDVRAFNPDAPGVPPSFTISGPCVMVIGN